MGWKLICVTPRPDGAAVRVTARAKGEWCMHPIGRTGLAYRHDNQFSGGWFGPGGWRVTHHPTGLGLLKFVDDLDYDEATRIVLALAVRVPTLTISMLHDQVATVHIIEATVAEALMAPSPVAQRQAD